MSLEIIPIVSRAVEDLLGIGPAELEFVLLVVAADAQVEERRVHATADHVGRCIVGDKSEEFVSAVQFSNQEAFNVFARYPNEGSPKRVYKVVEFVDWAWFRGGRYTFPES